MFLFAKCTDQTFGRVTAERDCVVWQMHHLDDRWGPVLSAEPVVGRVTEPGNIHGSWRLVKDVPDPAGSVEGRPQQPAAVGAVCDEPEPLTCDDCGVGLVSDSWPKMSESGSVAHSHHGQLFCAYCSHRSRVVNAIRESGPGIAVAPVEDVEGDDAQWESATWES